MADLSQLSDEQLEAYRDLLAQKSAPKSPIGNPVVSAPEKYVPEELRGYEPNFVTSPTGMIRSGARRAIAGVEHMAQPGARAKMGGASEALRGAGEALAPVGIGAAIVPASMGGVGPVSALTSLGLGTAAGKVASTGLEALHAPPEAQNLGEDVGNIVGGGANIAGRKIFPEVPGKIMSNIKEAVPDIVKYGKLGLYGGGALGRLVPPHDWTTGAAVGAITGAAPPFVRAVGKGVKEGLAHRETKFNPEPVDYGSPSSPSPTKVQPPKSYDLAPPTEAESTPTTPIAPPVEMSGGRYYKGTYLGPGEEVLPISVKPPESRYYKGTYLGPGEEVPPVSVKPPESPISKPELKITPPTKATTPEPEITGPAKAPEPPLPETNTITSPETAPKESGLQIPQKIHNQSEMTKRLAAALKKFDYSYEDLVKMKQENPAAYEGLWSVMGSKKGMSPQKNYNPSEETRNAVLEMLRQESSPPD